VGKELSYQEKSNIQIRFMIKIAVCKQSSNNKVS